MTDRIKRNYKEILNIDYHIVDVCTPYKVWRETDGKRYTVYTVRLVTGPKPETTTKHNRRKKRKLIFWSIAIFGIVVITAITGVFLSLLGLVEW